jgi:DmsE family decaheme c-type cytochrome
MNTRQKTRVQLLLVLISLLLLPVSVIAQEYSSKGADSCLTCHKKDKWGVMPMFNTKHGSLTDPDAPFTNLQCEACHGPSQEHRKAKKKSEVPVPIVYGKDSNTPISEQNEACLSCHENHTGAGWFGSRHESVDVGCTSCHQLHADRDPMFDPLEQQETCFSCHPRIRSDTYKASSHPLRFGSMACSSCHDVHDGNNDFLLTEENVNDTCHNCHADKRGPFLWEHAPVTESCTLCHDVHGSNHPALLTKRPPLLCQQCHSASGHPGEAYTTDDMDSGSNARFLMARGCQNCHTQVHGSNHPSGSSQIR